LCCRLISEERGDRVICEGEPGFTIVFDPVDGSANAIRGLDLWVTAMAYSPATENVHFGDFTHASVRLSTGEHYHASRGGGAFLNKDEIHTAGKQFPGKPMFSVYLSGSKDLPPGLGSFLKKAKIRALGSIALDICLVAAGHFDGIADVRNLISSWDVIAASLVLDEAGGVLTDCDGNPVNWGAGERDLSIVAARNEELHSMLHSIL
jgi:fructose-1,6-bisphosphatase/inositol monophosphatase family enzyme